jgi:hypothetical protein
MGSASKAFLLVRLWKTISSSLGLDLPEGIRAADEIK